MIVKEGLIIEEDGTLGFGNHEAEKKQKVEGFQYKGNTYKVSTYQEATRLEKNDELVLETVPGATLHNFNKAEDLSRISFSIEGFPKSTIVTAQLEENEIYRITSGKNTLGNMKSNISGKVKFSVDLTKPTHVIIEKI
ncbi:MAG: endosialidase [Defluviitaleaceae bacterium]|nr:endosialidase [Defluviitaleaceae bacterium]